MEGGESEKQQGFASVYLSVVHKLEIRGTESERDPKSELSNTDATGKVTFISEAVIFL